MRSAQLQPTFNPTILARCRLATLLACLFVWLAGFTGLLGWIYNLHFLKAPFGSPITMKANTAICLMLAAISLALLLPEKTRLWQRLIGEFFAVVVVAIALMTLSEHLAGWNLRIDELLFKDFTTTATTPVPGRMGPPASTSLILSGLALLLLNAKTQRGRVSSQYLALLVGVIALLPLIGYSYHIQPLYNLTRYTIIAPHTAVTLGVLAISLLLAKPNRGIMAVVFSEGAGGVMARRLLLPAILIPFIVGWLRTLAEDHHLVDPGFGRSILILALIVIFTTMIWSNARLLMRLGLEMQATQEQLRESEQRFRLALQTAPVMVYTNDLDLRYTWIHGLKNFQPEQIIGRKDEELLPFPGFGDLVALKRRVIETGRGERGQIEATIDGKRSFYDVCAEPLRAPNGKIEGVTVASMDVTSHKNNEQKLLRAMADAQEARTAAEKASSTKDQFLAVLSHELRTPLTPVMTLVQLLEDDAQLPPPVRDSLSTIRRNVELEIKLIDDLLDLTRVTRGKLALHYETVDIHEKLGHILQSCETDIRAKRVQLTVELGAQRANVRGDVARLQQVLWNLLKNSVKFTPSGGHITVRTSNQQQYLSISIEDNGIGIDPAVLPRIFNAFEQGNVAVNRQFGGLGLGLAISKSLVEMHGGTITASSAGIGQGSTFNIVLPVAPQGALHALPGDDTPAGDDSGTTGLSQLRVLLVEDHADTAQAMAQLLRSFGCRVRTADSVAAALKAAQADQFDVLMSDLGLPDGSGLDLMRQLLAKYKIKGIAVSGFGMDEDIRKSRQAGFKVHLTKPVNVKELEQTLAEVANS